MIARVRAEKPPGKPSKQLSRWLKLCEPLSIPVTELSRGSRYRFTYRGFDFVIFWEPRPGEIVRQWAWRDWRCQLVIGGASKSFKNPDRWILAYICSAIDGHYDDDDRWYSNLRELEDLLENRGCPQEEIAKWADRLMTFADDLTAYVRSLPRDTNDEPDYDTRRGQYRDRKREEREAVWQKRLDERQEPRTKAEREWRNRRADEQRHQARWEGFISAGDPRTRRIIKLKRMTVANGCTPEEEAVARAKLREMES